MHPTLKIFLSIGVSLLSIAGFILLTGVIVKYLVPEFLGDFFRLILGLIYVILGMVLEAYLIKKEG